jgi:hypothetical protein
MARASAIVLISPDKVGRLAVCSLSVAQALPQLAAAVVASQQAAVAERQVAAEGEPGAVAEPDGPQEAVAAAHVLKAAVGSAAEVAAALGVRRQVASAHESRAAGPVPPSEAAEVAPAFWEARPTASRLEAAVCEQRVAAKMVE